MKSIRKSVVLLFFLVLCFQYQTVAHASSSLEGMVVSETPVYENESKNSQHLRTFSQGKIIRFNNYSDNWYKLSVWVNGGYKTGFIPKNTVETATDNQASLEGIVNQTTSVFGKNGNELRSFSRGNVIRFRTYSKSWYELSVYVSGGYKTGYISKSSLETPTGNQTSLRGIVKETATVYGNKGKKIKSFSRGNVINFRTYSKNWYELSVYANGGYKTGYISSSLIETAVKNQVTHQGIVVKDSMPVYSKNGNLLKKFNIRRVIRYRTFSKNWYELSVYENGGYQNGYIPKSSVETAAGNQVSTKVYASKRPTPVYGKNGRQIKTYEFTEGMQVRNFTQSWYKTSVYLSGAYVDGYIRKGDVRLKPFKVKNYKTNTYDYTFENMVDIQMSVNPKANGAGTVKATRDQVEYYANPANFSKQDNSYYQFLVLSESTNLSATEINKKILYNKGSLKGTGQAFVKAGKNYHINEAYLIAHTLHETSNGTSTLASGVPVDKNGELVDDPKKAAHIVYNMYGYGANDSEPLAGGAKYAFEHEWFTPSAAVLGGAKQVSSNYIQAGQDTLYEMRWNPANPGTHQYASHVAWAVIQTASISDIYNLMNSYNLTFEVPSFAEQPDSSGGTTAITAYPDGAFGYTTAGLNFRKGPSTDYEVMVTIPNGTRVDILGENQNGWYKIIYNGKTGWVSEKYVDVKNLMQVVNITSSLNVRSNPSTTDSTVVGSLENGDYISAVTDENGIVKQGDWYNILYNGKSAWVHGDYVKVVK